MEHIIETDMQGALTLSPELLGGSEPRTRYIVENQGELLVLRPAQELSASAKPRQKRSLTAAEWWQEWETWSEQVTQAWNSDRSAAEIIAEMRHPFCPY